MGFCLFSSSGVSAPCSDIANIQIENVVILGSGPAGLTAAIYAARSNLSPLVIEGEQPGGQLTVTNVLENFPGFPEGTKAPELMMAFRKQAENFGTRFIANMVTHVDLRCSPFALELSGGQKICTKSLIVATGAKAKWLGLENELRLIGKGVSSCATCDGFFFKNQDIAVVGGGDVALEEAVFLTRFAKSVTVVVRSDKLKASKIMQERAFKNPKITFLWETSILDILGAQTVEGIRVLDAKPKDEYDLALQGVFVAIGHEPNTKLFADTLRLDERGYLLTENGATRTSVPGVFAAGDVTDSVYRQAITAAGSGCKAAMDAERYLEDL